MKLNWNFFKRHCWASVSLLVLFTMSYLIVMICSCRFEGPVGWVTKLPFSSQNYFQNRPLKFKTGFALWIDERRYLNGDLAFYYYAHSQVFSLDKEDIALLYKIIPNLVENTEQNSLVPREALGLNLGFYESRFKDNIRVQMDLNLYGFHLSYYSVQDGLLQWPLGPYYNLASGKHTPETWRLWEKYSQRYAWREMYPVEKRWILAQRAHDSELQDVEGNVFALRSVIGEMPIDTGEGRNSKTNLKFWQYLRKLERGYEQK